MSLIERVYNHLSLFDVSLALLGLFVFCCLREKLTNKHGPMLWPVFGITLEFFFHKNDVYGWVTKSLKKSRNTFLYRGFWLDGSHGAVTCSPANVEYMLKTNFKNFPKGTFFKDRFKDLLEEGIFNADDESWKEQRRVIITEMHSTRFMEHSFQTTQRLVRKKLLKVMESFARSQEAFDLQDVLLRLTFDIICIAGLGDDPETLAQDLPQVPFAKAFDEATESTLFRFMIPPFIWKPMRFLDIGYEKGLRKAIDVVHGFVNKMIMDPISETLRLYPPIPMEMKQAIEDDMFPDGTFIRKGSRVYFSIYAMGRMESVWGKDCEEFRPERWIQAGKFVSDDQYKYVVFNAGPRMCLGKTFAYLQMKMIAASVLLRYSIKVAQDHVVVPRVTTNLYMKYGLKVTITPRSLEEKILESFPM
ncbi:BnaA08g24390D [Brassica napus]|uniref:BnaA08g24390D protein n=1 Tax=Brassica napus TaxID=3708 RepID=A0A078G6L8_BRANA|nr:BnaA08g24390D [Brassica napus]